MSTPQTLAYHNNIDAMLWLDVSAERDALYLQAFELAKIRVEQAIAAGADPTKLCVFTDCDETIIDNSAYNAWLIHTGRNYHDDTWAGYCNREISTAKPGAVDFAGFLTDQGVRLFYVTSRRDQIRPATASNLASLGFPVMPSDQDRGAGAEKWSLFLKGSSVEGEPRKSKFWQYEWIARTHKLQPVLWLGDNLGDFAPHYKKAADIDQHTRREAALGMDRRKWGDQWIAMPNPTYGDWLRALKHPSGNAACDDTAALKYAPDQVRHTVPDTLAPKMALLDIWDGVPG